LPKNRYRKENEVSEKIRDDLCNLFILAYEGSDGLFVIHGCVSSRVLYGGNRYLLNVGKYDIQQLFVLPYKIKKILTNSSFLNNYLD
jgi:hypothetical protein